MMKSRNSLSLCTLVVALAVAPGARSAPIGDIVGLKPGATYDEIVSIAQERDDVELVETAEQWLRQSHGIATRQLLRASDGIACAQAERAQKQGWHMQCDTLGGRFQARKDISNEIIVAFTGMPEHETAGSIWRRTVFQDGANPTISALEEALTEKYGKPHVRQIESGYYSTAHRHGATNLSWLYTPDERPISNNDALKSRCVNGPQPWFTTKHSWNKGCGLTIRAEILPVPGNNLLAQELNVTVVHQKQLIEALGRFDADLKVAVESQAGKKAKKPDL